MKRQTILFLAANPRDMPQLAIDEECAAVERELRWTEGRDDFELRSRWAVSVDDLMHYLNELSPVVLHFSGHGSRCGASTPAGIFLQDRDDTQHVSEYALARMIEAASPRTRLVVLNACHSNAVAASLREVVDCVIGVDGEIDDNVARSFAVGFYRAIGYRCSVGNAARQSAATLFGKQMDGKLVTCHPHPGLDPERMFLHEPSARRVAPPAPSPAPAAPHANGPHELFLACPPANRASARTLCESLAPEVRVFLTGGAPASHERRDQAQRAARATVLLISRQSDATWHLSDEVLDALRLHRASPAAHSIVPVLLEPGLAVPRSLGSLEAIDAAAVGFPAGVAARLRERVEAMRRAGPPPAAPLANAPANDRRANGNYVQLYERLGRLSDTTFDQIVTNADLARDALASTTAALTERALDAAQLAALDPALYHRLSVELDRRAPSRYR